MAIARVIVFCFLLICVACFAQGAPRRDDEVRDPAETQVSNNEVAKDGENKFCVLDGKHYQHGENVSRTDPCEMCLCFSGEILCWLVSCPLHSPRKDCRVIPMEHICCPVYECPLASNSSSEELASSFSDDMSRTVETSEVESSPIAENETDIRFNETNLSYINIDNMTMAENSTESTCVFKGILYQYGDVVAEASGPCIDCRCGTRGKIHCTPHTCAAAIVLDENTKGSITEGAMSIKPQEKLPLMISTHPSPASSSPYSKRPRSGTIFKKPTGSS